MSEGEYSETHKLLFSASLPSFMPESGPYNQKIQVMLVT